jgi:hypothetical protein
MTTGKLLTDNPELLYYVHGNLHITILGGIKLTGLDRLKVTLKVVSKDNKQNVFRHNLDLYNSIQTSQLIERVVNALEISTEEMTEAVNHLTTALEEYRTEHLEALKPKPQEKRVLTDAERKAALTFLKSTDLLKQTRQAITQTGIIGEETNALIAYLIYTSRNRATPLHLICLGASGTGKTWLQERVSELIPEEDKLAPYFNDLIENKTIATFYFNEDDYATGVVLKYDEAQIMINNIGSEGDEDGISCHYIDRLIGLRYNGLEEQKIKLLYENRAFFYKE